MTKRNNQALEAAKVNPVTNIEVNTMQSNQVNPVTTVPCTEVALPADLQAMLLADAGAGYEEADNSSFSIPYIYLLQPLSPIVADAAEDSGVRAGMFYNSVSGEVMREFTFVPAHFQRRYSRWSSTDGHYMGTYLPAQVETNTVPNATVVQSGFNYLISDALGQNDQLTDVRIHYILYLNNAGAWEPAILTLSRTQIKHSRRLVTMIRTSELALGGRRFTPPSWAMQYHATTAKEKNDKGQWYVWNFTRAGTVTDPHVYQLAKDMYEAVSKGELEANVGAADDNPMATATPAPQPQGRPYTAPTIEAVSDADVPF